MTHSTESSEPPADWDEERYGRRWGIVLFPEMIEGERWFVSGRGWHRFDPDTGNHVISQALPVPGVFEGTVSYDDLTAHEKLQNHLAFPNRLEYFPDPEQLAQELYSHSVFLAEGRLPEQFELLTRLLPYWVQHKQVRGLDVSQEMEQLLAEAAIKVTDWKREVQEHCTGEGSAESLPSVLVTPVPPAPLGRFRLSSPPEEGDMWYFGRERVYGFHSIILANDLVLDIDRDRILNGVEVLVGAWQDVEQFPSWAARVIEDSGRWLHGDLQVARAALDAEYDGLEASLLTHQSCTQMLILIGEPEHEAQGVELGPSCLALTEDLRLIGFWIRLKTPC